MQTDMERVWQSFPGVDAILLGAGRSISKALAPDLLRVVTPLGAARLDPRQLGMLVTRGEKLPANGNEWTLDEYNHLLELVMDNKLVVYASADGEGDEDKRFSRLEACRVILLQLKYLKRTCRECVMGLLMGRWG
jgi:hypothetical protein